MNTKKFTLFVLLGVVMISPAVEAQVKHIEMRVEGMT
jgi:hypothetical protein